MKFTNDDFVRYCRNPSEYRDALLIEANGEIVPFGSVMEPFQRDDFEAMDAGWLKAMGFPSSGPSRAWIERSRGHSKTHDEAVQIALALAFAVRPIAGVAAACDRDQAKLIRDALNRLLRHNEQLAQVLTVTNWSVENTGRGHPGRGARLEIIASDVGSSYGITPSFVLCDEVCHWGPSGEAMWHSLISSAAKRQDCMLVVLTNAGVRGTWQGQAREHARQASGWHFSSLDGPQASWITSAILDEQRLLLPTRAYSRLWLNRWQDEGGDVLERADIEACCVFPDRPGPQDDHDYVGALDLSVRRDHSAFLALGVSRKNQHIHLAECHSWKPPRGGEIDLAAVQETVAAEHKRFKFVAVVYDEHQAAMMAQTLSRAGIPMERASLGAKHQMQMASAVLEAFRSRRISLYRDDELIRDLLRLQITTTSYGYRLSATRTADGHCDRASAMAMALPRASELAANGGGIDLDAWLSWLGVYNGHDGAKPARDPFRPIETVWSGPEPTWEPW